MWAPHHVEVLEYRAECRQIVRALHECMVWQEKSADGARTAKLANGTYDRQRMDGTLSSIC